MGPLYLGVGQLLFRGRQAEIQERVVRDYVGCCEEVRTTVAFEQGTGGAVTALTLQDPGLHPLDLVFALLWLYATDNYSSEEDGEQDVSHENDYSGLGGMCQGWNPVV